MASSSLSRDVVIYIFNTPEEMGEEGTPFTITDPDVLKRQSPHFRRLINNADSVEEGEIPKPKLYLPKSDFVDISVVKYILTELQHNHETVIGNGNFQILARYCAALYHYECIPDIFEKFGFLLKDKSSKFNSNHSSMSSDVQQKDKSPRESLCSWHEKFNGPTCFHLIIIAFVLGIRQILEEEIRLAVWESDSLMELPVIPVDIKALRRKELHKLFNKLQRELDRQENDSKDVIKSTRKKLRLLGDFSRSSALSQNSKLLEEHTPSTFLWNVESILLGPPIQMPSPTATLTSSKHADRIPPVLSPNEIAKRTKTTKKKQESPDSIIRGIYKSLNTYKKKRQKGLAAKLMTKRNETIYGWRREIGGRED